MIRQFTATVYIVDNQGVLLIYHRKIGKWLPPGGHLDPGEIQTEGAKREVFEETGLHVNLISQENLWIERANAKSLIRPFMCLLEEIPAWQDQPAHQHIDFIYLACAVSGIEKQNERESAGLKWFNLAEIESLEEEREIFLETKETVRFILTKIYIQSDLLKFVFI